MSKRRSRFDGVTADADRDDLRLGKQLTAVRALMFDKEWHFVEDFKAVVNGTDAAITARIRDLRKEKFGGWIVEAKAWNGRGLWAYRWTGEKSEPATARKPEQLALALPDNQ